MILTHISRINYDIYIYIKSVTQGISYIHDRDWKGEKKYLLFDKEEKYSSTPAI